MCAQAKRCKFYLKTGENKTKTQQQNIHYLENHQKPLKLWTFKVIMVTKRLGLLPLTYPSIALNPSV